MRVNQKPDNPEEGLVEEILVRRIPNCAPRSHSTLIYTTQSD
jgi:hypothetical protein